MDFDCLILAAFSEWQRFHCAENACRSASSKNERFHPALDTERGTNKFALLFDPDFRKERRPLKAMKIRFPPCGFTVVELLLAVAVIAVLGALTLNTASFILWKSSMAKAKADISAIESALENYKMDNGGYPRGATSTDLLSPIHHFNPVNAHRTLYINAGRTLYTALCPADGKTYLQPSKTLVDPAGFLVDPFGSAYGYSTATNQAARVNAPEAFDLWSTGGKVSAPNPADWNASGWVRNW